MRQQVVEDRASREAAEKVAADREASAAGRAAEQQRQHDEMMQMLVRLTSKQSGTEEQKNQDEQVREAPATSGEVEDPEPSTPAQVLPRIAESVVPVEVGPREGQPSALERANLARANKTETTVSTVSPLKLTRVGDL